MNKFKPTFYYKNILEIPFEKIKREHGIKLIIFDKDNTITKHKQNNIYPPFENKLNELKEKFKILIISNSSGSNRDLNFKDAIELEKNLNLTILKHGSKKPFLNIFKCLNEYNYNSNDILIIGDRLFTDIYFANKNNIKSILVDPISKKEEEFGIKFFRFIENFLIKRINKNF
eukprot:gene332-6746_t